MPMQQEKTELAAALARFWQEEEPLRYARFEHEQVSKEDLKRLEAEDCILSSCRFSQCGFMRAELTRLHFFDCDLSGCDFNRATLFAVTFERCRLTGASFKEAFLRDCRFLDCRCDLTDFSMCTQKPAKLPCFERCDLREAQFFESSLADPFRNCRLCQANFYHTPLRGADLTTCEIEGICVSVPDLKGTVVNGVQAAELARLIGVVVKP